MEGVSPWAYNEAGEKVSRFETDGATRTSAQDNTAEIADLLLVKVLDSVTLLSTANPNDIEIDVETTGHVPAAGEWICLKEEEEFFQAEILSQALIAGNQYTLQLDSPIDSAFSTAGGCSITQPNMATSSTGTRATPDIFTITPAGPGVTTNVQWDIARILVDMEYTTEGDDSSFGDLTPLTNGVVIRTKRNGVFHNLFNFKTNGDFKRRAFDRDYNQKTKQAAAYTVQFRRSFNGPDKNGVVIRLGATAGDQFQFLIQDNISALTHMFCVVQGHVVTD